MQRLRYNHSLLSAGLIFAAFFFNLSNASAHPKKKIYESLVGDLKKFSCEIHGEDQINLVSYIEASCLNKEADGSLTAKKTCTGSMSGSPAANLIQLTRRYCDQANAMKQANSGVPVTPEQRKSLVQNLKENKKEVKAAAEQIDKAFDLNIKKSATDAVKSGIDSVKDRASSLVAGTDSKTPQAGSANALGNNVDTSINKAAGSTNTQVASGKSEAGSSTQQQTTAGNNSAPASSDSNVTTDKTVVSDEKPQTPEQAQNMAAQAEPAATQAANSLSGAGPAVAQAATGVVAGGAEGAKKAAEVASTAKNATSEGFVPAMNALIEQAHAEYVLSEVAHMGTTAAQVEAAFTALRGQVNSYKLVQSTCNASNTGANTLCSFVTNPKVLAVQQLMAVATPIITKSSSARESCEILEKTNKVGQFGMAAANVMCLGTKTTCDISCAAGLKQLTPMVQNIAIISADAPDAAHLMMKAIASEETAVGLKVGECKKHSLSAASMLAATVTLATSSKSAENCKEKLTAGGGASGMAAGAIVTTAEHCSKPENANSSVCRCTQNPNADGCFGSFAGVKGVATQNKNTGSGMASNSGSSSGVTAAGPLSNEQKQALGFNTQDKNKNASTDSMMAGGLATANGVGSSSDGSGSGLVDENGQNIKTDTTKKSALSSFSFGSLSGGLGSFFGSNKGGKNAAALKVLDPQKAKEQELAIKRKLASEQLRSEVSMASGKSNFDKIRNRYQMSTSSLFNGQ